jgi:hypothetical protein
MLNVFDSINNFQETLTRILRGNIAAYFFNFAPKYGGRLIKCPNFTRVLKNKSKNVENVAQFLSVYRNRIAWLL